MRRETRTKPWSRAALREPRLKGGSRGERTTRKCVASQKPRQDYTEKSTASPGEGGGETSEDKD